MRSQHPQAFRFVEPSWQAPLDATSELAAVPSSAQISGMFIAPLVAELRRVGATQLLPRERFVAFRFYPLKEHVALLVSACEVLFGERSLRSGLRALGRGAPLAFESSTLGKVVFGSAQGAHDCIAAFAKGYELNLKPGRASVLEAGSKYAVVRLQDVHYFLDCHHVGAFEGVLKHARVRGRVRVARQKLATADLLCEWE